MKHNKIKLVTSMVMIMVLSLAIFSLAFAAIYEPEFVSNKVDNITEGTIILTNNKDQEIREFVSMESTDKGLPVYDAVSLLEYDGKNGQPAYIAFEGVVYEVGKFTSWVGGFHNGYQAGKDLSEAFKDSPHGRSIFEEAEVVGNYREAITNNQVTTTENIEIESEQIPLDVPEIVVEETAQSFNSDTLSKYNGKNGQPAYIAFEGVVYEVGKFTSWVGGFHNGYQAGKDLTEAFKDSPHAKSIFNNAKVIGSFIEEVVVTAVTPEVSKPMNTEPVRAEDSVAIVPQTEVANALPNYILAALSQFKGTNGQPAYIAVNGLIYDVTADWRNGQHQGLQAGSDMTTAFARSPHSQSILSGLPLVGMLDVNEAIIDATITSQSRSKDDDDEYEYEYEDDDEEDDEDEDEDDEHDD